LKKLVIFAVASAAFSTPVLAAPVTDNGVATAEIVSPIAIAHDAGAELSFGTFATGTGGTVVVTQGGAGSATGDVLLVAGSSETADSFTVTGDANRGFSISAGNGSVSNGTDSMSFVTDVLASDTLDGTGTATVSVGGTLTVAGTESTGLYTGSYSVTVDYL